MRIKNLILVTVGTICTFTLTATTPRWIYGMNADTTSSIEKFATYETKESKQYNLVSSEDVPAVEGLVPKVTPSPSRGFLGKLNATNKMCCLL